ncbi:glutamyl-tRNA amidotransferase subunit A-like protein [Leptotrombidium deliense]|uniref:Glutamyl-tRNA amidotransferase subunit A-like protein n=1 Tax=Leptotrombidium deliense TaxID=299467 RepID=A0A443SM35_9ACAR|nr:glutamyl-tRNA amidotransferase subunit A-like protein [Leptotrombidium deliense]
MELEGKRQMTSRTCKEIFQIIVRYMIDWFCVFYGSLFNLSKKHYIPAITDPMLMCPALTIADRIRNREWKAYDVMNAYLKRIKDVNPFINAVIDLREEALVDAAKIDEILNENSVKTIQLKNKPLLGVPFTCKDTVCVKGMRLTTGIYNRRHNRATEDADVVTRLREAGAIPIAITNVPEHAIWWDTENMIFGRTNNPYDLSRIAGGSSGGEAALIACAGSVFGIGTDSGGSIRLPSFFCGIFGHKATPAIISTKGIFEQPDQQRENYYSIGPMCRYASDLLPILKIMIGDVDVVVPSMNNYVDFSKINIYYMEDDFDATKTPVSEEIKEGLCKAVKYFRDIYKTKCEAHYFPKMKDSLSIWIAVMKSISVKRMEEYLAEGEDLDKIDIAKELIKSFFGLSKHTTSILFVALSEKMFTDKPELIDKELRKMTQLRQEFRDKLRDNGVFLYPTHPETAPKHGTTIFKSNNVGFVSIFNVINTPVTQCTLGLTTDGMPFGIQVVSNECNDYLAITVATELANVFGGWVAPCVVHC